MSTKEELSKQAYDLSAQAGDVQYKILCFQAELQALNTKLNEVHKKFIELSKPAEATEGEVVNEVQGQ